MPCPILNVSTMTTILLLFYYYFVSCIQERTVPTDHTGPKRRFSRRLAPMACWDWQWEQGPANGHRLPHTVRERRRCGGCADDGNVWRGKGPWERGDILSLESLHRCDAIVI
jgi:hypothetical protein